MICRYNSFYTISITYNCSVIFTFSTLIYIHTNCIFTAKVNCRSMVVYRFWTSSNSIHSNAVIFSNINCSLIYNSSLISRNCSIVITSCHTNSIRFCSFISFTGINSCPVCCNSFCWINTDITYTISRLQIHISIVVNCTWWINSIVSISSRFNWSIVINYWRIIIRICINSFIIQCYSWTSICSQCSWRFYNISKCPVLKIHFWTIVINIYWISSCCKYSNCFLIFCTCNCRNLRTCIQRYSSSSRCSFSKYSNTIFTHFNLRSTKGLNIFSINSIRIFFNIYSSIVFQ